MNEACEEYNKELLNSWLKSKIEQLKEQEQMQEYSDGFYVPNTSFRLV